MSCSRPICFRVIRSTPSTALVNQQHFDLLVFGFMGHTRLYEQIIGGTTERLVRLAACSILAGK